MKTIKIFLASSEELAPEREKMTDLIYQLNKLFKGRGLELDLEKWEYLDSSMSSTRKQDEYNEVLKDCEMCLVIFWRRFGEFTSEEFDTAYQQMASGQNPKKIYVFFKTINNDHEITPELKSFKESIYTKYGHFFCKFDNVDTMKLEFLLQLENYQKNLLGENAIAVQQEHVYVGNEAIADLNNIPFAANNEGFKKMQSDLKELKEEIEGDQEELEKKQQKQEKWKAKMEKDPNNEDFKETYEEVLEEVEKLIDKLQPKLNKYNKMKEAFDREQQNLFNTARRIAELRGSRISERMVRAIEAFESGDAQRADTILDEAEHDADEALADIRMAKEVGLKSLEELILKASVKMANDTIPIDERVEETLKIYEKADEIAMEIDYDKEKYVKFLLKYGVFLYDYAKYEEAVDVDLRLITLSEKLYGTEHQFTVSSYNNLALVYAHQSKFPKALELFQKALDTREKTLGVEHPDTASSYDEIGSVYADSNNYSRNYSKALEYISKAISIREKTIGSEHPDTATSYNNYGYICHELNDYSKALEYYLKAQHIFEKVLGLEKADTAISFNNIGCVYCDLGKYSEALEYHFKALSIRTKLLGLNHPDTANSYDNIGDVYQRSGNFQNALEFFNKALMIYENYEKLNGTDRPSTSTKTTKRQVEAMKRKLSENK
jgi:tetratricopeptide (TPR) repeat protein